MSQSTRLRYLGPSVVIDGDDVGVAAQVERLDQVGTNKAGSAGDDGSWG